jgi:hypothetical protein
MIVQDKIHKELVKNLRHKTPWMNNLFVNLLKKDTNKASQFKIQLEILLLLFPKKVKAKVFTQFCLNNIDNKKV